MVRDVQPLDEQPEGVVHEIASGRNAARFSWKALSQGVNKLIRIIFFRGVGVLIMWISKCLI